MGKDSHNQCACSMPIIPNENNDIACETNCCIAISQILSNIFMIMCRQFVIARIK